MVRRAQGSGKNNGIHDLYLPSWEEIETQYKKEIASYKLNDMDKSIALLVMNTARDKLKLQYESFRTNLEKIKRSRSRKEQTSGEYVALVKSCFDELYKAIKDSSSAESPTSELKKN